MECNEFQLVSYIIILLCLKDIVNKDTYIYTRSSIHISPIDLNRFLALNFPKVITL